MCDYSLHAVRTDVARVGDRLLLARFHITSTRGFVRAGGDCDTAICLQPGTEVEVAGRPAVFAKRNQDDPHSHHDAVEFADGGVCFVHGLDIGTPCTVLQLPAVKPLAAAITGLQPSREHLPA